MFPQSFRMLMGLLLNVDRPAIVITVKVNIEQFITRQRKAQLIKLRTACDLINVTQEMIRFWTIRDKLNHKLLTTVMSAAGKNGGSSRGCLLTYCYHIIIIIHWRLLCNTVLLSTAIKIYLFTFYSKALFLEKREPYYLSQLFLKNSYKLRVLSLSLYWASRNSQDMLCRNIPLVQDKHIIYSMSMGLNEWISSHLSVCLL